MPGFIRGLFMIQKKRDMERNNGVTDYVDDNNGDDAETCEDDNDGCQVYLIS